MQTDLQVAQLFSGELDPRIHIEWCVTQGQDMRIPSHFWVQVFPHSLGPIPKAWFIQEETKILTNDQGAHFISSTIAALTEEFLIQHHKSSPYHL
jgi:hypothetical protein